MDRLSAIFQKQRELTLQFHPIEIQNRLNQSDWVGNIPVDIRTFAGQEILRGHAWRIVEEVGEMLTAHTTLSRQDWLEEVADVFHFVVELCIVAGIDDLPVIAVEDRLTLAFLTPSSSVDFDQFWLVFIEGLADAMHELKWKAWKKNPAPSNVRAFQWKLEDMVNQFFRACSASGISADELHCEYFKKHKVNQDRISAAR